MTFKSYNSGNKKIKKCGYIKFTQTLILAIKANISQILDCRHVVCVPSSTWIVPAVFLTKIQKWIALACFLALREKDWQMVTLSAR